MSRRLHAQSQKQQRLTFCRLPECRLRIGSLPRPLLPVAGLRIRSDDAVRIRSKLEQQRKSRKAHLAVDHLTNGKAAGRDIARPFAIKVNEDVDGTEARRCQRVGEGAAGVTDGAEERKHTHGSSLYES